VKLPFGSEVHSTRFFGCVKKSQVDVLPANADIGFKLSFSMPPNTEETCLVCASHRLVLALLVMSS